MNLYPKLYCKKITDVKIDFLRKNNIKGIILDIDNTLMDYDLNIIEGLEDWKNEMKNNDIKLMVVSNTNKKEKVKKVCNILECEHIIFAMKPLKRGFVKAQKILGLNPENIAVVGDQISTDILGANRCKMFSILVEPIDEKDIWITKIKRPIEKIVIDRYLKTKEVKKDVHK